MGTWDSGMQDTRTDCCGYPVGTGREPTSYGWKWVRVGGQAIFETFTTASPELLRAFIVET